MASYNVNIENTFLEALMRSSIAPIDDDIEKNPSDSAQEETNSEKMKRLLESPVSESQPEAWKLPLRRRHSMSDESPSKGDGNRQYLHACGCQSPPLDLLSKYNQSEMNLIQTLSLECGALPKKSPQNTEGCIEPGPLSPNYEKRTHDVDESYKKLLKRAWFPPEGFTEYVAKRKRIEEMVTDDYNFNPVAEAKSSGLDLTSVKHDKLDPVEVASSASRSFAPTGARKRESVASTSLACGSLPVTGARRKEYSVPRRSVLEEISGTSIFGMRSVLNRLEDLNLGDSTRSSMLPSIKPDFPINLYFQRDDNGPVGIENLYLNCYINAAVQSLFAASVFCKRLNDEPFDESRKVTNIFLEMYRHCIVNRLRNNKQNVPCSCEEMYKYATERPGTVFKTNRHEDCLEFLEMLLNDMIEETKDGNCPVGNFFQGISYAVENFSDRTSDVIFTSLLLPGACEPDDDIQTCMNRYLMLESGEGYVLNRRNVFKYLPPYLILSIDCVPQKENKATLSRFFVNETVSIRVELDSGVVFKKKYGVVAVTFHEGISSNSGHYTVATNVDNKWYLINDDRVSKLFSFRDLRDLVDLKGYKVVSLVIYKALEMK